MLIMMMMMMTQPVERAFIETHIFLLYAKFIFRRYN